MLYLFISQLIGISVHLTLKAGFLFPNCAIYQKRAKIGPKGDKSIATGDRLRATSPVGRQYGRSEDHPPSFSRANERVNQYLISVSRGEWFGVGANSTILSCLRHWIKEGFIYLIFVYMEKTCIFDGISQQ